MTLLFTSRDAEIVSERRVCRRPARVQCFRQNTDAGTGDRGNGIPGNGAGGSGDGMSSEATRQTFRVFTAPVAVAGIGCGG
jgi:hypothetical protein